jgi:HPt (histidine-containing phosphotransfer) domain-containing protein
MHTVSRGREQVAAEVWARGRPLVDERLEVIVGATEALAEGSLDEDERGRAWIAAQMLAGSLGSFGFTGPSTLAAELEDALEAGRPLRRQDAPKLQGLVRAIRAQLPLEEDA